MRKKNIFLLILFLALWIESPAKAEEIKPEESGITSRVVFEKQLGESPFELDVEFSYEMAGSKKEDLIYGSIAIGWHPTEYFYFSLGVGAGEVGFPVSYISPLLLLEGKSEFSFAHQNFFTEVEMEYFPLLVKNVARFEFLFNHPNLEELFLGVNIVIKDLTAIEVGPEVKFPLFAIGELKASDAIRIDQNYIFQDARIVLERKF